MRLKHVEPWRLPITTKELLGLCAKGLDIPEVWTAAEFIRQGHRLILAIDRIAKITQRRAAPYVARKSVEIFTKQLNAVIALAIRRAPGIRKNENVVDIFVPQHESIWLQALDEVMKESGLDITFELIPPIQSVMAQGYSKTGTMLNIEADPDRNPMLAKEARGIAQKITRINDTTRKEFERHIRSALDQGLTVPELAKQLEADLIPMQHNRAMTIARTELQTAWTHGSAQAMKESKTLETVSIIGCQAAEPKSPHYQGRSTCNYPDLPVPEIDAFLEVGFHPNHTGVMVPSGFR